MSEYTLITRQDQLGSIAERLASSPELVLDIETTSLSPHDGDIRLIQLEYGDGPIIIDLFQTGTPEKVLAAIREYRGVVTGHNIKFEQAWFLCKYNIEFDRVFDTYIASRMLTNGRDANLPHHLKLKHDYFAVLTRYLGIDPNWEDCQKSQWGHPILTPAQLHYAARDVSDGRALRTVMRQMILDEGLARAYHIEMQAILPTAAIEVNGMAIDRDAWLAVAKQTAIQLEQCRRDLNALTGKSRGQIGLFSKQVELNWDSSEQVMAFLHDLGIKVDSSSKMDLLLATTNDPVVAKLLQYRGLSKRHGTYGESFLRFVSPVTGRIHTNLRAMTDTARYASSSPNLQNLPAGRYPGDPDEAFRRAFRAPEGRVLCIADHSQIELRVLGIVSRDEAIKAAYVAEEDIYIRVASMLLDKPYESIAKKSLDRQTAKAIALALGYGMGTNKLTNYSKVNYGVELSLDVAEAHKTKYFQKFAGVARWHQEVKRTSMRAGQLRTMTGFRRFMGKDDYSAYFNTPVQSPAAQGLKMGMRRTYDRLKKVGGNPLLTATVHDEGHVEGARENREECLYALKEGLLEGMYEVVGDWLPLQVDAGFGDTWADK